MRESAGPLSESFIRHSAIAGTSALVARRYSIGFTLLRPADESSDEQSYRDDYPRHRRQGDERGSRFRPSRTSCRSEIHHQRKHADDQHHYVQRGPSRRRPACRHLVQRKQNYKRRYNPYRDEYHHYRLRCVASTPRADIDERGNRYNRTDCICHQTPSLQCHSRSRLLRCRWRRWRRVVGQLRYRHEDCFFFFVHIGQNITEERRAQISLGGVRKHRENHRALF